jgi:hypothetical protein
MTTPPTPPPAAPAPAAPSPPVSGGGPATPTPAPSGEGGSEARLDRIERTVAELAGLIRGQASTHPAPGGQLDRHQVEDITRRELERGQADTAAREAEAKAEGRLAAVEASVAKLAETKPRQPTRRITAFFWPGHDRD